MADSAENWCLDLGGMGLIKSGTTSLFAFRISFPSFVNCNPHMNPPSWTLVWLSCLFSQVPSCLILQMPRFGNRYKMYDMILPNLELDVTHIVENGACYRVLSSSLSVTIWRPKIVYKGRYKKEKGGGEKEHLVLKYVTILTPVFKIRNLAGKMPEHQ